MLEILTELDDYLSISPALDYITFSGAGEPTLYSRIGEIIDYIKDKYPLYKLALLTNGVLLNDTQLLKEILRCDLILPSLDACREETFIRINRPHKSVTAATLISGLTLLRKVYSGSIWLEIFIITGVNDTPEELDCLAQAIGSIKPDRVQINSLDRPGAEEWVLPAENGILNKVKSHLETKLDIPVEIIAKHYLAEISELSPKELEKLKRLIIDEHHSAEEISELIGWHINEVSKVLRMLHNEGRVDVLRENDGVFYLWKC